MTAKLKVVNPEPNDTDLMFRRSSSSASDFDGIEGPFSEHGIKHKKDYTWFWLTVWFITCVFGTTLLISMLERKDTTIDQKQLDCLSSRGQGAAVIFDDKGSVVDCKRRR